MPSVKIVPGHEDMEKDLNDRMAYNVELEAKIQATLQPDRVPEEDGEIHESYTQAHRSMQRQMTRRMLHSSSKKGMFQDVDKEGEFHTEWNRIMHETPSGDAVHSALRVVDAQQRKVLETEIEERKMKKFNSRVLLRVVTHQGNTTKDHFVNVVNSIYLDELRKVIAERCGIKGKFKIIWLNLGGETVELTSQRLFWRYADTMWCTRPWELHVQEEGKDAVKSIALQETAKQLFEKYDTNNSKSIEASELERMLKDLNLERLEVSEALISRFVQGEFERIDVDKSKGLSLKEFTDYVTSMTRWMRDELQVLANHHNAFELMASRAIETSLPPIAVPPPPPGEDHTVIHHLKYGIRVEVPVGAMPDDTKLSLSTLAPNAITGLSQSSQSKRGEFVFTPIVRVDYPAFEEGDEVPHPGDAVAKPFAKALTLVMPHCFDPQEGEESCVVLGAPHGGTQWQGIHDIQAEDCLTKDHLKLEGQEMKLLIPYAGIFCGFTHPDIEDIAVVRCWLFSMPELPRDDSSAIRLHLCPDLPDQIDEMKLAESCEWGLTTKVGESKVMKLCQGAKLKFTYLDQEGEITWMGARSMIEFMLPAAGTAGADPEEGDPDPRKKFTGTVAVEVLEGDGNRGRRSQAVAKRAGIPITGYEIPFETRLKSEVRPNPPHSVELRERSQFHFTLTWKAPKAIDGDGDGIVSEITHYSIEISTTAPSGTYYPWQTLWVGPGHAAPDFNAEVHAFYDDKADKKEEAPPDVPGKLLSQVTQKRLELKAAKAEEAAEGEEAESLGEEISVSNTVQGHAEAKKKKKVAKKGGKRKSVARKSVTEPTPKADETPTFSYTLACDPALFGRLRMRCWNEDIPQPSMYCKEVKLTRFQGKLEKERSQEQKDVDAFRMRYYTEMGGTASRIGPPASLNNWGGDAMPPPPPPTDRERAKGLIMAPVPYDVPRLPPDTPGLQVAVDELVAFYRALGVEGGGGGMIFGMRIDNVLHAIVGSPLQDPGSFSPRRTVAQLEQPLVAMCEVVYNDVLLPLLDTVVVARQAWMFVDEKIAGIIAQVVETGIAHYELCSKGSHLKEILVVLHQVYEMMQQCEHDQTIAQHLTDPEYSRALKKKLLAELKTKMTETLWRLSTELLEMQLDADDARKRAVGPRPVARMSDVARMQLIAHNNKMFESGKKSSGCTVS